MISRKLSVFLCSLVLGLGLGSGLSGQAWAAQGFAGGAPAAWWNSKTGSPVSLSQVVEQIQPGSVVLVGEIHNSPLHSQAQVDLLKTMALQGLKFDVGMELIAFLHQRKLNQYLMGEMSEEDFLRQSEWGAFSWDLYREQVLMPLAFGGHTWALNVPRLISNKVARGGLESLSEKERKYFVPPEFTVGNDHYRERFEAIIEDQHGGHKMPPEIMNRWFTAQSLWDDYMAYIASLVRQKRPDQVMVIFVGQFHVAYGGGLKDRLMARGVPPDKILTISQDFIFPDENLEEVAGRDSIPHPVYGPLADFLQYSPFEAAEEESHVEMADPSAP